MLSLGATRPEKVTLAHRAEAWGFAAIRWILCRLGPVIAARLLSAFMRRRIASSGPAQTIARNIDLVFSDKSATFRAELRDKVLAELPVATAEFAMQGYWRRRSLAHTEHNLDADWLRPYLQNERPAIFLIGHFLGWEVNIMTLTHFQRNTRGIYKPPRNPLLETYFRDTRTISSSHTRLIPRDMPGLGASLQSHLAAGGSLMYALDAPLPGPMLPFLGRTSPTTLKPYAMAAEHGVPIIPIRCGKRGLTSFFCEAMPPLFAAGTSSDDVEALAVQMNALYSQWIMDAPEQWYWADKFFKANKQWEARQAARAHPSSSTSQ